MSDFYQLSNVLKSNPEFKDLYLFHGKSAYQAAVEQGYVGTEKEWIESLKDLIFGTLATFNQNNPHFIYIDLITDYIYRYDQATGKYKPIGGVLGETAETAYRGDRGKIAYDHSQSNHVPWIHVGGTGGYTGYWQIKIKNPNSWMLAFTIRVYQGYQYSDIVISGYNYGSCFWYSPQAILNGSTLEKINVKFGYDSAWNLWVAIPADSYTGISIFDVCNGYEQTDEWKDKFEIVNVSTLSGTIQAEQTPYAPLYRSGGSITGNVTISGTLGVGSSVTSDGNVSATGSVSAASVSATGNISSTNGNISSGGTITASGKVSGASAEFSGDMKSKTVTATTTISATGNISSTNGNISSGGTITATGTITGSKVYNAVWNDYAEWFEKANLNEMFIPGDICTISSDGTGVTKAKGYNSFVIGVYSDTYGHVIGGENLPDMEDNIKKFIPIGLAGRVKVNISGKAKIGDIIVASDIPGVGKVYKKKKWQFWKRPDPRCVVGYCYENKNNDYVERCTVLISR